MSFREVTPSNSWKMHLRNPKPEEEKLLEKHYSRGRKIKARKEVSTTEQAKGEMRA